jgi:RimJ/RimL family protein N-acetyltransferase
LVKFWLDPGTPPAVVAALLQHGELLSEDFQGSLSLENVKRIMSSPTTGILVCRVGETPAGIIGVRYNNAICVTIVVGFFKQARGKAAREFLKLFINAMFKSGIVKINAEIAVTNRAALWGAGFLGFKREGLNRQGGLVKDKIVDMVYVGLTRGDFKHVDG